MCIYQQSVYSTGKTEQKEIYVKTASTCEKYQQNFLKFTAILQNVYLTLQGCERNSLKTKRKAVLLLLQLNEFLSSCRYNGNL